MNVSRPFRNRNLFLFQSVSCEGRTKFLIDHNGHDRIIYCNDSWLVVQSRHRCQQSFNLNWTEYKSGFGTLETDYWMGLDLLASLTANRSYQALFKLTNTTGTYEARYSKFHVGNESTHFILSVDGYSGEAGDALRNPQFDYSANGKPFSTPDRDHDTWAIDSCAALRKSGWWYGYCGFSINEPCPNQHGVKRKWFGMHWPPTSTHDVPLTATEMMVKPWP